MYFKNKGINLYYEKHGNGKKSIVILPGWGDTRKTFSYMISFLEKYFTVYIFDYPGFGNSNFPEADLTIYDYSDIIYNFIKFIKVDDPVLIGHSFGGRIIITLLGYYNYNFSNVILINSAGIKPRKTLKNKIRNIGYKLLQKVASILPKKLRERYRKYLFNKFASDDYKILNDNMKKTFKNIVNEDLKVFIKSIKSRVLIIWGNKDDATPVSNAYEMNKLINESELIVLDNVSHFSYLEKPYLINSIIFEQLKDEIAEKKGPKA